MSSVSEARNIEFKILAGIFGNGTFYFVTMAGFLFAVTTEDFSYPRYLRSKFFTVILPYVLISIPGILLYVGEFKTYHVWVDMDWFASLSVVAQIMFLFVTGTHLGPLWFVPMIVCFYLASPIFLLVKDRVGPLTVALGVAFLIALVVARPEYNSNAIKSFIYYTPAFLLGMLLQVKQEIFVGRPRQSQILLCVAVALSVVVALLDKERLVESRYELCIDVIAIVGLFGFFHDKLNYRTKWLDLFARLSFYLFFIHGYFIGAFRMFTPRDFTGFQQELAFMFVLTETLLGCLLVFLIVKISLGTRSRYVIGA